MLPIFGCKYVIARVAHLEFCELLMQSAYDGLSDVLAVWLEED